MIQIRPEAHQSSNGGATIDVERDDDNGSAVMLSIDTEDGEHVWQILDPDEAHALAAALAHFADRAEGVRR